jgi:hypothetical protein
LIDKSDIDKYDTSGYIASNPQLEGIENEYPTSAQVPELARRSEDNGRCKFATWTYVVPTDSQKKKIARRHDA